MKPTAQITRRDFAKNVMLSSAAVMLAGSSGVSARNSPLSDFDLMKEVRKYRKLDAYATSSFTAENLDYHIEFADRLGIEKMFIANPMTEMEATPDEFRALNDKVAKAVKQFPDRLTGQFTVNPLFRQESLDEISRCLDMGMTGTRLYHQVKINDPVYAPVIEKLTAHHLIIFMHGECQMGVGGYRMKYDVKKRPAISTPDDFAEAALRYPEAVFQFAHLGGGSDWECMCKTFAGIPNIYVDTGGSNNEENMIDFALQHLGEDRLLFGTDNSFYQSVGKILASGLTETQKRKLFFENYQRILKKGGFRVD